MFSIYLAIIVIEMGFSMSAPVLPPNYMPAKMAKKKLHNLREYPKS